MKRILEKFANLPSDREGATAVEYGLIVSLIVIAMIGALRAMATRIGEVWAFVVEVARTVM